MATGVEIVAGISNEGRNDVFTGVRGDDANVEIDVGSCDMYLMEGIIGCLDDESDNDVGIED